VIEMGIVDLTSLGQTVDRIDESLFYGRSLSIADSEEAAQWIATRQGQPGSYANMFAPMDADMVKGVKVFTGEIISSKVGIRHVLGEEACRTLLRLNVTDPFVRDSLNRATAGMLERLRTYQTGDEAQGFYCCGSCSVAYWRHIAAGGLDKNEERLTAGLEVLKSLRAGQGKWRRFPFYYTLLALNEIALKPARDEMRYTAPVLQRYLTRVKHSDKYAERRQILFQEILTKC
jgi:hypothetical protein